MGRHRSISKPGLNSHSLTARKRAILCRHTNSEMEEMQCSSESFLCLWNVSVT